MKNLKIVKIIMKTIGIILVLFLLWFSFRVILEERNYDNIVKVVNEHTNKKDFEVTKDINTIDLIGNHFKVINGYQIYKDDYVTFYVDNPLLRNKKSDTFVVNFETKYRKTCTNTFQQMDFKNLKLKDVFINGESAKIILKTAKLRYFECEDLDKYEIKYEFYF